MSPQVEGGGGGGGDARQRLRKRIGRWENVRKQIEQLLDRDSLSAVEQTLLADLRETRADLVDSIQQIVENHPKLYDNAVKMGFRADLLTPPQTTPGTSADERAEEQHGVGTGTDGGTSGGGDGQSGGGGGAAGGRDGGKGGAEKPNLRSQAVENRLLGDKDKHYDIVRGPKGSYIARYKFRIDGEVVQIGIRIPKGRLERYGVKPGEGKQLTAAQLKRVKNIGWADELAPHIRKGDAHAVKALVRYMRNQYGGQAILEDDEVMSKVIANSMFGWTAGEFENQLRQTRWYKNTNEYQRQWVTVTSPKQKRDTVRQTLEQVTNHLENVYGLDWMKHVKGGMEQARKWAENIASGKWGAPAGVGGGFEFWSNREFDKAAAIEKTPAWIQQQQDAAEQRAYLNRPEDMFETLRSQAMAYLGQINGKPLIDRDTIMGWATDIVTEKRSDADWMQFLRQQMRNLHPYFDENVSFTDQASPYKSIAESVMGTPLSWDDKLLRDFTRVDETGKPIENKAMSLHDYELMLRDPDRNPRAWQEGTRLWDEGLGFVSQLENVFLGVG